MSFGSILRRLRPEDVPATMQWLAWGGVSLAFAAYTISSMSLSVYAGSDYWLNSPGLIFVKLGAVMMMIAFSWLWSQNSSWSWVRQFGLTSLLVYWVHIELVYGRWLSPFKESLNVGQTIVASVAIIALMLGLSLVRTNWTAVKAWFGSTGPAPRRVSGD
jgi:hypothetical protein